MLVGAPHGPPDSAPLLMDGLLVLGANNVLPLPEDHLDFNGVWTSWRDALPGVVL